MFGELTKTSQEDVASTFESLYKSLGSIELRYRRIKKCKSRVSEVKGEFDTPEPTTVHEDSKMACLAHQGRRVGRVHYPSLYCMLIEFSILSQTWTLTNRSVQRGASKQIHVLRFERRTLSLFRFPVSKQRSVQSRLKGGMYT